MDVCTPDYVSPVERSDYRAYWDAIVTGYNPSLQNIAKHYLSIGAGIEHLKKKEFVAGVVGSDGRFEKGPVSKMEIVVYTTNRKLNSIIKGQLRNFFSTKTGKEIFEGSEIKYLSKHDSNDMVIYYENDRARIFPSRFYDFIPLDGNKRLVENVRRRLAEELDALGSTVKKRLKGRRREYRNITLSGKQVYQQEELQHFDLENGLAFYKPDRNVFSVKYGPLKLVQSTLEYDITQFIRGMGNTNILTLLPTNTVERLRTLEVMNLSKVSNGDLDALTDHYKYFLWFYHLSQFHYGDDDRGVTEMPDKKEMGQRLEEVVRLVENGIIKRGFP